MNFRVNCLLNVSHTLLPLLCPQVCFLRLCLNSCHANRVISTIFLDSIVQFISSVAQLCPTLCDPMNCSTAGLPVHHQLLDSIYIHVCVCVCVCVCEYTVFVSLSLTYFTLHNRF